MPKSIKTPSLYDSFKELDTEYSVCVGNRRIGDGDSVVRLKTVKIFGNSILVNLACLADTDTYTSISGLVGQLMSSEMVIYNEGEKEIMFKLLSSIKDLIETVRNKMKEVDEK